MSAGGRIGRLDQMLRTSWGGFATLLMKGRPPILRSRGLDLGSIPFFVVIPLILKPQVFNVSGMICSSNTHILLYCDELTRPDGWFILASGSPGVFGRSQFLREGGGDDHDLDEKYNAAPESPQSVKHHCFPPWNHVKRFIRSINR